MAELAALQAFIDKRQRDEGALGTRKIDICLAPWLADELRELIAERERLREPAMVPARLGGGNGSEPNTADAELDAVIAAKQAEVRAATVTVYFQALLETRYQQLLNEFDDPDTNKEQSRAFYERLAEACHFKTLSEGHRVDLPWSAIRPGASFAEWDAIETLLWNLNRRVADIPLLSMPSASGQQPNVTPTPA